MERTLVKLLGFNIDTFNFEQAINYVRETPGQIVTINPEMIENAQKNEEFFRIINESQLVIPDGIGVEIGLKILGHNVRRIPGIEFGKALLKTFTQDNKTVALVGAKPEIIELAKENLEKEIPNLSIVYFHDGYFQEENVIIDELLQKKPDLVLVALGSPKQEFFINKLKSKLPKSTMIGLGGSFDVWSGVVKRAPEIWQKLGLEWLYRTILEPQRFRRIFPTLPLFLLKVVKERFCKK